MTVDLALYNEFVDGITSETSKQQTMWMNGLDEIRNSGIHPVLLTTATIGLAGESGEFAELVKKMQFHGKPVTPELKAHLAKELGDIIFYWTMACQAVGTDPEDVIKQNVAKLKARYPGGVFSVEKSENRAANDI